MKKLLSLVLFSALFSSTAMAQFTGPSANGNLTTVAQANTARLGSYITVTGNIVAHQYEDYFLFRDSTGEIRVEIDDDLWQGRQISPEMKVKLFAEVDRELGGRYLDVETLQIIP